LSHISNPFCCAYFGHGFSQPVVQGWPQNFILLISDSHIARITLVSHLCQASLTFLLQIPLGSGVSFLMYAVRWKLLFDESFCFSVHGSSWSVVLCWVRSLFSFAPVVVIQLCFYFLEDTVKNLCLFFFKCCATKPLGQPRPTAFCLGQLLLTESIYSIPTLLPVYFLLA
jgi:hypothetical protein